MSISRNSRHKRRATGGRMPVHQKKRKFEMGRVPAMTKIGKKRTILVRGRGNNTKHRALKLDHGNFSWGSESQSRMTRIIDVVYNATNNELVRTKTIVKNCIVKIDANPFRTWYLQHYNVELNSKKEEDVDAKKIEHSKEWNDKMATRQANQANDKKVLAQFNSGKLLACVSSRPGQCGRVDGYILEGKELEFYLKKIEKKK
jgi:small subunit ribosomal protein S8e